MVNTALSKRLLKLANNSLGNIYADSKIVELKNDYSPTNIPMLNIALSGKWNGGISPGITVLAGPSKMGKTFIGLIFVEAYLRKYEDAICVFLDSELGANTTYFNNLNIDMNRLVHLPIKNIEDAKFQSVKIMEELQEDEHVIFFFDSIGNTASKKELDDALDEKSVADMSRAKQIKSYFRMITPYVNLKQIPCIVINHTYETMSLFPQTTMGGGTGPMYSADTVLFLSKSKEKDGTELSGFNFKLKVEKSRTIREGSTFVLNTTFNEGVDKYSDLFEFALESGFITSPTKGYYQKHEKYGDEKKYRKSEFDRNDDMWKDIIEDEEFRSTYEKSVSL